MSIIRDNIALQKEAKTIKDRLKANGKIALKERVALLKRWSSIIKQLKATPNKRKKSKENTVKWGVGKNKLKSFLPILSEVTTFFLKELRIPSAAIVKVNFIKMERKQGGYFELKANQSNEYVININDNLAFSNTVRFIAHELTHVAQSARGDLKINEKNEVTWKGKLVVMKSGRKYGIDHLNDAASYDEYSNLPPELEAFKNQEALLIKAKQLFNKPIESLKELGVTSYYFDS